MKYRSPSPDSSLPTPPRSPRGVQVNHSAVNLLDSLTAFYQQERYWVHHTRAALELALVKGIDAPPTNNIISASSASTAPSPHDNLVANSMAATASSMGAVKPEPSSPTNNSPSARKSLWMRRKQAQGIRLKLDGLAHTRRRRPHRAPPSEPGARLLEMFSELVDARMESCQRISRMVRDASRPAYCVC
ncbi:hypothetical protein BXZ70DRAFT_420363 [Cristinia sonorae]|uniref:Uncharacterized protein n=1 Tax=Cristinia sonorae TaxID=1940300 RepID=A0A8K0XTQ2_9AGAR|nr:hypothetical protein BXZ70DRAFT_420363 [Cristinia sonorae]